MASSRALHSDFCLSDQRLWASNAIPEKCLANLIEKYKKRLNPIYMLSK